MPYSEEETAVVRQYPKITIDEICEQLGKSRKSVIGKLAREGLYRRAPYMSKTGEPPITKPALVAQIEEYVDVELEGLEKASKQSLKKLLDALEEVLGS